MSKFKTQNDSQKRKNILQNRSFHFSLDIISFVSKLPNKQIYWVFRDQLLRSATSIGANIIEAKASSSKREFIKFYEISLKSANETIYWLKLLKFSSLSTNIDIEELLDEAEQLANMLGSSLLTLKGKNKI